MISHKKTVRIAGVLFLAQLITATISYSVILEPILYGSDFLAEVSAHSTQIKIALFLDLFCGAAIVSIAVLLFPILKKYSERIALWYVGLRAIEFTMIIISGIFLLTIFSVSQEYVQAAASEAPSLAAMSESILSTRGWTQNMTLIVFSLGASMFYYLLFRSRLLPRFIPAWGLIAVILVFTEIVLETFGHGYGLMMMMPMGLNEIFLGIWLIVKGFNTQEKQPLT